MLQELLFKVKIILILSGKIFGIQNFKLLSI